MTEKSNGHDPMTVKMVEVLERIEGRLEKGFAEVNARFVEVNARLAAVEGEVRGLRGELNLRLDAFQEHVNEGSKGLEERVKKLEAAVFKPTRPRSTRGARR
jgi:hypothetical protein